MCRRRKFDGGNRPRSLVVKSTCEENGVPRTFPFQKLWLTPGFGKCRFLCAALNFRTRRLRRVIAAAARHFAIIGSGSSTFQQTQVSGWNLPAEAGEGRVSRAKQRPHVRRADQFTGAEVFVC